MDPRKIKENDDSASERDNDNPNANSDPESEEGTGALNDDGSSSSSSLTCSTCSNISLTSSSDQGYGSPNPLAKAAATAARARHGNDPNSNPTSNVESARAKSDETCENVQRDICREQSSRRFFQYPTADSNGFVKDVEQITPVHSRGNIPIELLGGSRGEASHGESSQYTPARITRRRNAVDDSDFVEIPQQRPEGPELESPEGEGPELESPEGDDPTESREGQEEKTEENGESRQRCHGCRKGCKECIEFLKKR